MITSQFQDKELSLLGFGTMRLPTANGEIDEVQVDRMVDLAMEAGVNYFDTAYPYHNGLSEIVIGRSLSRYPRESYYLADKFPGHQISSSYDPAAIFEEQLQKCGVEYFDFYLLHNVYEKSLATYLDPQWGILDYFLEQKKNGRIRHLGFSTHGREPMMRQFLELCGKDMEFCQIQLNYLDWTLQSGREKVELLNEYHIPIWVMEPVRGGKLCALPAEQEARLKSIRPEASVASWGLRYLQDIPGVQMILSGMSNIDQMQDNLKTFAKTDPITDAERAMLHDFAESMKDSVPCTACRYCTEHCPMELDIPILMELYNEIRINPAINVGMRVEALGEDKQPGCCIGCGACAKMCPQNIAIPEELANMTQILSTIPSWAEICRQRDEAARAARGE